MRLFALLFLVFAAIARAEDVEADVEDDAEELGVPEGLQFTDEQRETLDSSAETHEFQAEVNRLMDIIIHSLYSKREVFLRELISNSADASDKVRFLSLTDEALKEEEELDIKIVADEDAKTLTITDRGVGMTKSQLVSNLGIVAKSGTSDFLEAAASGADALSLIGQFGVGFYSVYLVADKVTVASKHDDDEQHVWESTANSVFTVGKDPRGNTLGRGTSITLHLKEDAEEFLKPKQLTEVVTRYSQFIDFPINLEVTEFETEEVEIEEEEEVEKPEESEESEKPEGSEDDEELEVSEDGDETEEKKEPKKKTKTIEKEVKKWKTLNEFKAIWTRNPKEVTKEEYAEFYKSLDPSTSGALDHVHFNAEGEVSFKALLYVQAKGDQDRYNDLFTGKKSGVKLYVRRVLISDEFEDFLPRYLGFIKGIVDSDDLPLNVSRETLAQNRVLKVIGKKLVRKVLDMLKKMADAGEPADEEDEDASEEDAVEDADKYEKFFEEHGKAIKFGIIDDRKNKAKLSKLLRYQTSQSDGKYVSLASYIRRMPESQKKIFYYNCEEVEKCAASPFIEKAVAKGYEVLFMTDVVDEYVTQHLSEYDGVDLQSVVRDNMSLDKEERRAFKTLKEEFKGTAEFLKETYGDRVSAVKVSSKLDKSPCVVTSSQYGWTANMERIMKAQTFANKNSQVVPKNLEINPRHPIIMAIKDAIEKDPEDEKVKDLAQLLLDGALVNSGFSIDDYAQLNKRTLKVLASELDVDPDAKVEEEAEDPEVEEEEEEEEEEEVEEAEDDAEEDAEDAEEVPEHGEL